MNENWQEIVSILHPHFENNSTEDVYQRDIESCLQYHLSRIEIILERII